jgi:hypothetical protein
MSNTEQIARLYHKDDLEMLQQAQLFHDLFITDQVDFTAAFPNFATPYETNFQTKIDDADAVPLDSQVAADIAAISYEIEVEMEKGRKAIQILYSYVKLAFDSNPLTVEKFKRPKYSDARQSSVKMKELLERTNALADSAEFKPDLLAKGYTQGQIDELLTIMTALENKDKAQEEMMSERRDKTQERINAYNAVWNYMLEINDAAKVVFIDNPAKLWQYTLYHTSHPAPGKVTGLAYDQATGTLTYDGLSDAVAYEVAFAPDMPEPIFINIYNGPDRSVVYDPGGPDNYLFRVRAINASGEKGEWSDVLVVTRS